MSTTIQDMMNKQRDEDNRRVIAEAAEALLDRKVRTEFPEKVFQKEFLPYFSDQKPLEENLNALKNWIAIAGNGFKEVQLVDQTGKPTVVVPGMNSTMGLNASRTNINLAEEMRQAEIKGSQFTQRGVDHMTQTFEQKREEILATVPSTMSETEKQWNTVFQHFGLPPIGGSTTQTASATSEGPRLDEDVDFE